MAERTIDARQFGQDADTVERAAEELKRNRPYQRLLEKYKASLGTGNLVLQAQLNAQLKQMERQVIDRLMQQEMERRKDVRVLTEMLQERDPEAAAEYERLMGGLSVLLDVMDTTFSRINILLKQHEMRVTMNQWPELQQARRVVMNQVEGEVDKMAQRKHDLWAAESDRLYDFLMERMAVYQRKAARIK